MPWTWQLKDWPNFRWRNGLLEQEERRFAEGVSVTIGSLRHLPASERDNLAIALLERDALGTSAIEGEQLDRDSVQSSLRKHLGLAEALPPSARRSPREYGVAELMADLYQAPGAALTPERLFTWHRMLMHDRRDLATVGQYRQHAAPMQIVSCQIGDERVHYEAPPSASVPTEMAALLGWFARTAPGQPNALPAITRAAIAHLWFECIHPFEDGNGRIGRAVVELALAQDMQSPQRLMSVSTQLLHARADYYAQLQAATGRAELEVTPWVQWFATRVQGACEAATQHIQGALEKTRFWSRVQAEHSGLSASQHKALGRLFDAGPQAFVGGLSTEKYVNLTGVSRATAYRELTQLTELGLLVRTGQGRGTRYGLAGDAGLLSHE